MAAFRGESPERGVCRSIRWVIYMINERSGKMRLRRMGGARA